MTNPKAKWPLEGFFTCAGGGISVEIDCLGTTFESRTASHPLTVTFPQLDSRAPLAPLARPAWKFRRVGKEGDSITVADEDWGSIGSLRVNGRGWVIGTTIAATLVPSVRSSPSDSPLLTSPRRRLGRGTPAMPRADAGRPHAAPVLALSLIRQL
jgi:hypothetical protein